MTQQPEGDVLTREERFEAIALAEEGPLVALADTVLGGHEVRVLRPPAGGAVMMRAIETAEGSTFNLGEVAVTEAEVEVAGERGYCVVMGFAPAKALAGAVIDAAAEAGIAREPIEEFLRAAVAAKMRADAEEWARLAPTRVQFDEIPS
jgi:alpha-D-ribose 1-methylphosphonate 5-triphosphate synthase subunit PhnG